MKKQKKLIKRLFILVLVLIFVLFVMVLINIDFIGFLKQFFEGTERIVIEDNCGVVLGNLIHEIKSEENCRIMCYNECGLIDKEFLRVEFLQTEQPCYKCDCYCK